jgi:hypothetical protein
MRCKFRALLNLCFFSYINCHSILITNAIEFYMCLGFGILEVFLTISSGQHYVLRMHVCLTFPPEAVLLEWTAGSGWFLQNFWVRRKNFNSFKLAFDFEFVFFSSIIFYVPRISSRPPMSIYNAVSLMELCGPCTMTDKSWTFCTIDIFVTHTHLASLLLMLLLNSS